MSPQRASGSGTGTPTLDNETYALVQELFQLVRAGDTQRLQGLLERGLVPNLRDSKGDSLLMLASYHGHRDMTELLLKHGGDPELANDRGLTPLAGAAFKGDSAIAELLIEHGAVVNARSPDGKTPLMYAAMFDRVDIVELLLGHGADPALCTEAGDSALALAQAMGAESSAGTLVVAAQGSNASTPRQKY